MKLENSNLEIIKLTWSFICHHLANKPHYWLDFALWRLGHPFSDLLRKVGLLTKDRMLSIYKNDFTTFTQPKNPFVIFQKPGADNDEDLIYTDKNPFVIGTSFAPAISLHLGQFHLWDANHYSAILNLYTYLCLVNWDRFHFARGHWTQRFENILIQVITLDI